LTTPLPSSSASPPQAQGRLPLPDASPPGLKAPGAALALAAGRRLWPLAAALAGGGLLLDGLGRASHLPVAPASAAALALYGLWSWERTARRGSGPAATDPQGWLCRLERLDGQFTLLAADGSGGGAARTARAAELERQRQLLQRPGLHLAVVGSVPADPAWRVELASALRGGQALTLHWSRPLPLATPSWQWPEPFSSSEQVVYCLKPPLMAADLRWLQALPADQPLTLLVQLESAEEADPVIAALRSQLPASFAGELCPWRHRDELPAVLAPLAQRCRQAGRELRVRRQERCLAALHRRWQGELETLRRQRFQQLQQRTQWLVAAGVVAAPVPSLDLLVLAVANGLMVREMARLWDCPWSAEQLRSTAVELARASLSLGVVEWTTQALAGVIRWHGATWLLGSAVQALSAAYLTRVVGRAMADTLARSVGVAEPDLERIRREAPLLVARAAEEERLNWQGFVQQGRQWLADQGRSTDVTNASSAL
jgi:uncharacterized protein (DUF697 family)